MSPRLVIGGLALYVKSGDSAGTSTCSGSCATSWPPLTLAVGAQVVAGVAPSPAGSGGKGTY